MVGLPKVEGARLARSALELLRTLPELNFLGEYSHIVDAAAHGIYGEYERAVEENRCSPTLYVPTVFVEVLAEQFVTALEEAFYSHLGLHHKSVVLERVLMDGFTVSVR